MCLLQKLFSSSTSSITLSDTTIGGIWSVSNGHTTVIGGVVNGLTVGIDTVSYYLQRGCATAEKSIQVLADCNTEATNILLSRPMVNVYPNPAQNQLSVTFTEKITGLAICNLLGQTLYYEICESYQVDIDVSYLPTGVYFIKINGMEVRKFEKD